MSTHTASNQVTGSLTPASWGLGESADALLTASHAAVAAGADRGSALDEPVEEYLDAFGRWRTSLRLDVADVAREAGVDVGDVLAVEAGYPVSRADALALWGALARLAAGAAA